MNRILLILCLIFILLSLSGCAAKETDAPEANEGVLDITAFDFSENGSVRLDGMWEFFWSDFIEPSETGRTPDAYIYVPGIWNEKIIGSETLPGTGYCTYRLKVKSSLPEGTRLGLRLFTFSSAYRLYLDNELVAQNGVPAKLKQDEIAQYRPQTVYFSVPNQNFSITVHVSNYSYARGGFWYSAFLGTEEQMAKMHDSIMQREAFLFGALVIIIMFYGY